MKKTKPTNYEAAKACVSVGEEVSSEKVIEKMLLKGRREIPTKRSLSANMKKDIDFIVIRKNGSRGPTIFQRIS